MNIEMRAVFFILFAMLVTTAILTTNIHWIIYVPMAGTLFASITGMCPMYTLFRKL